MLGIAILIAALGLALVSLRNLLVPLVGAIISFVAIPEVSVWSMPLPVVGGVNVGVLVIILTAATQVVFRLTRYVADVLAAPVIWIALSVWIVGGTITNFLAGIPAPGAWLELVLAPPLAYLLLQRLVAESPAAPRSLARIIVAVAAAEALLALTIWAGAFPQPFADAHATFSYWWDPEFTRALGTLDHPLALAGFMLVATPLLLTVRRNALVIALGALFLATIAAAESRGALLLAAVAFVVVLVRRRVSFVTTLALVGTAAAAVVAVLSAAPELVSGLTEKLSDDNGSANARVLGLAAGLPSTLENPVVGGGQGTAFATSQEIGLGTSFENPTVMTALDWGLAGTVAFTLAQLLAIRRGFRRGGVGGSASAGLVLALYLQTYSSYALPSGTSMLFWLVLGLALTPRTGPASDGHTTTCPRPLRTLTTGAL
ncbi:O-antigen ligase family protein [Curtobacterium sp. 22159]|uniref:O-antigen ligase family protein n=1 Tax=Curtobacterium sp. 22159 TaxID=3453882 RepID=UPI003F8718E4